LLNEYEWEGEESGLGVVSSPSHVDQPMFTVYPKDPTHLGAMFVFQLPKEILTFPDLELSSRIEFDGHDASAMKFQFENPRLFRGKRDYGTWGISDTYVEAPEPLCDIFYFLQCMLPGVLTITREEDPDDRPGFINSRGLPRQEWLLKHQTILQEIFDEDQVVKILDAASDSRRAYICRSDWI